MHRRSGLTLIELVTAVAITALLLTGAMAAVGNLARSEERVRAAEARRPDTTLLATLLVGDVVHADRHRRAGPKDTGLELQTHLALRARDMEAEHIRSTVRYEVRQLASRPWLVRVQETGLAKPRGELAAPGITAITLAEAGAKEDKPLAGQWQDVADRSVVTLTRDDGEPLVLDVWKK